MKHRFAPTKSWTASRFQATVIPDPAISIWEQLCSIQGSSQPLAKVLRSLQLSTSGQFERLLDSDEAAALLGIHKKTLQRMARSGEVPGVQIGDLGGLSCVHSQRLARLKTRRVVLKTMLDSNLQLKLQLPKATRARIDERSNIFAIARGPRYQFGSLTDEVEAGMDPKPGSFGITWIRLTA